MGNPFPSISRGITVLLCTGMCDPNDCVDANQKSQASITCLDLQVQALLDQHRAAQAGGQPCCAGLLHRWSAAAETEEKTALAADAAGSGTGLREGRCGGGGSRGAPGCGEASPSATLVISDSPALHGVIEAEAVATSLWLHAVALVVQVGGTNASLQGQLPPYSPAARAST